MKKAIILATIVAIAAISGIIGYCNMSTKSQLNPLALANIEALSEEEEPVGWTTVDDITVWEEDHFTFIRHFCHHKITCVKGGPDKTCTPREWTAHVDIPFDLL